MRPRPVYDAVVIGSGFGGSIMALRLAEAGQRVLVVERGRRYQPEDFPRDVRDTRTLLWSGRGRRPSGGLYDIRFFSSLGVVTASGVGGGSLIYANIHIRPDPVVFDDPRWPPGLTRAALDAYYDKVAAMLGVAPLPEAIGLAKRDAFRQAAATLGREVFDPDEAVAWPSSPLAGTAQTCALVAECEFGCRHGAKRTADRTYLAAAERLGVEVRTGADVDVVRPGPDGYVAELHDPSSGERDSVAGRRMVLAAGTLGTNEILLRSRDAGALGGLSPQLGHGFSANGDFLGSIQGAARDLEPSVGPDVTSVMRWFETQPGFTLAAPTFNAGVMAVLASLGQPDGRLLRSVGPLLWRALPWLFPMALASGALSHPSRLPARHRGDPGHMTNLFCIGRDNANGRIRMTSKGLDIDWDYRRENAALIRRMESAMASVADAYGGTYAPIATWNAARRIISVHPLGGCRLSETPAGGVVSPRGEVHGHPGLWVADGSVVPSSIGFHPAMTIAALAERTAEALVADTR